MDKASAEKLSVLIMQINAKLDESVAFVRDNAGEEEFGEYRKIVGRIMGSLYLDIEEKLWGEYPELRPKEMGGSYEVAKTLFEPRFYPPSEE